LHQPRIGKSTALLNNVGQLVCQQPTSLLRIGRVLSCRENEVRSGRESPGAEGSRNARRTRPGVNTHLAEVVPECGLEKFPHLVRKAFASTLQTQRVQRSGALDC
jgi:hypothetical protein